MSARNVYSCRAATERLFRGVNITSQKRVRLPNRFDCESTAVASVASHVALRNLERGNLPTYED